MSKNKIVNTKSLLNILAQTHGKTIGLITGCFDVLHLGHIGIFQFAKKHVDILVVGIDSDEAVKATKGSTRPINTQKHRCQIAAELVSVDYVLPLTFKKHFDALDAKTYLDNLVAKIKPSHLITSIETDKYHAEKATRAKKHGAKLLIYKAKPQQSSTNIVSTIIKTQL